MNPRISELFVRNKLFVAVATKIALLLFFTLEIARIEGKYIRKNIF